MSDQVSVKPTTKICSHCQTSIPINATKCPQCHGDLRGWVRQHPIGTLFLFLIFGMMYVIQSGSTPVSPEESIANTKTTSARIIARGYAESVPLKSPSTADYERPTVTQDPKDKNVFEVSSYVDSENGFGAMIRTYWSMKLKYVGTDATSDIQTDKNWKIIEFIFDGQKVK